MNESELNNMTKRYKEEMMRLYQKSGAQKNMSAQSSGVMGRGAGMSGTPIPNNNMVSRSASDQMAANLAVAEAQMAVNRAIVDGAKKEYPTESHGTARDIAGTPIPGLPNASYYGTDNCMPSPADTVTEMNIPPVMSEPEIHENDMAKAGTAQIHCDCRFPSAQSIIDSIANTPMTLPIDPSDNPPPVYDGSMSQIQPRDDMTEMRAADNIAGTVLSSIILNALPMNADYTTDTQAETATAEILPDFALPASVSADSEDAIPATAGFYPSQAWISLTGDNSWGFLQFEVLSNGRYPLQNAVVTVRKRVPGGIGLLRIITTNRNGLTPTIALPAPALMHPTAGASRPFSEYTVTVRARGYYTVRNITVAVFAGSKTVQPISMIPLAYGIGPVYPPQPRSDGDMTVG